MHFFAQQRLLSTYHFVLALLGSILHHGAVGWPIVSVRFPCARVAFLGDHGSAVRRRRLVCLISPRIIRGTEHGRRLAFRGYGPHRKRIGLPSPGAFFPSLHLTCLIQSRRITYMVFHNNRRLALVGLILLALVQRHSDIARDPLQRRFHRAMLDVSRLVLRKHRLFQRSVVLGIVGQYLCLENPLIEPGPLLTFARLGQTHGSERIFLPIRIDYGILYGIYLRSWVKLVVPAAVAKLRGISAEVPLSLQLDVIIQIDCWLQLRA